MNSQNNWLSWLGNGVTTVAAYLGITTLDLTYLILAVLGFLLSFLGWLDRRAKIKADKHDFIANGGKLKPEENPNAKAIENELKDIDSQ